MINTKVVFPLTAFIVITILYFIIQSYNKKHTVELNMYKRKEETQNSLIIQLQGKLKQTEAKVLDLEKEIESNKKSNSEVLDNYNHVSESLQKANNQINDLESRLKKEKSEDENNRIDLSSKIQEAEKTISELKKIISEHHINVTLTS